MLCDSESVIRFLPDISIVLLWALVEEFSLSWLGVIRRDYLRNVS